MPVYEYRCLDCRKRANVRLSYAEYDTAKPVCPHCGSKRLKRRIGRVRTLRSEDQRMAAIEDKALFAGIDEDDPKSMGRMMREMASEMGEDMGGEFDEVVERLESGEDPEAIESSLEAGDGGGGFDDDF